MVALSSLVQSSALKTQGVVPSTLTGWLLGRIGVSFRPGDAAEHPRRKKAACCVSLDFDVTQESRAVPNRKGTHLLLDNARNYEVPLTWAICGSTAEKDPETFQAILSSGDLHEVASHTYSHLRVDGASPEELESDHQRWESVVGVTPRTFVFPFNKMGNFETLKRLGFTAYRGEGRVIGTPAVENGMCNVPPVMYLSGRSEGTVGAARGFIDLCIRYGAVFHLWSHPWSLAREGDPDRYSEEVLKPIFSYVRDRAAEGSLDLRTMGELAQANPETGRAD
jgi:peptidoglycan/xylan/chitin deacetylase (PgdA/CDA1 family)